MSTDDTYQGWANRETWALMLHINNDQGLYETFRAIAGDVSAVRDEAYGLLDPRLFRDIHGEQQPEALAEMAHEVGSLWRVNWSEVVEALTEE